MTRANSKNQQIIDPAAIKEVRRKITNIHNQPKIDKHIHVSISKILSPIVIKKKIVNPAISSTPAAKAPEDRSETPNQLEIDLNGRTQTIGIWSDDRP